jgi:hypothetical protein
METYENKRRRAKARLTEKQLTAHAKSRAAFARAREIWSAVPGCDPYAALRQAWAEVTAGKIAPNFTKAVKPPKPKKPKTNPYGLEEEEHGYTIRKVGNKHMIIDPDGNETGKYGMSEESAERLLAKHAR